jgi:hypothetical protein
MVVSTEKEIQMGSVSHFGNCRKYSWKDLPQLFLDEMRNAINRMQRPDRPWSVELEVPAGNGHANAGGYWFVCFNFAIQWLS